VSDTEFNASNSNRLLRFSVGRPVLVMFILFIVACIIKFFDSFVFRLDELIGEAILTKALGFILVAAYVWVAGRKLSDIGFHSRNLGVSLLIAIVGFGILYTLAHASQILLLKASGEKADLVFSAVDPKTGMSGGILFGIWLLLANLVNSAMEEGLFRGLMLRHFLVRFSKWGAIFFQAGLFALWHLSWPLRHLLDGQVPFSEVAFEAASLLLGTLISGVVYGYLYYRTDNLWGAFGAHTINNGLFNVLFIQTSKGIQTGLEFGPFTAIFLLGYILQIPFIAFLTYRFKTLGVKPWGAFSINEPFPTPEFAP
jgi:membrane protease YdiL (CAAX protease family)